MRRFFMLIPEAVQLVLQAGAVGESGDLLILEMGEPVRIVDLAHDLIRLSGLEPEADVAIEFVGVRPGEKLFEEFCFDAERMDKTRHPKIYVGHLAPTPWDDVAAGLALMEHTDFTPERLVREALTQASRLCIYTNDQIVLETLGD